MLEHTELIEVNTLKSLIDSDNTENPVILLGTAIKDPMTGEFEPFPNKVIVNSRYFDLEDKFSNSSSGLPHTLIDPSTFEKEARLLGINNNSHIVIYDFKGLYCAPRVWWMFKVMGHHKVSVLNGGLPAWIEEEGRVSDDFCKASDVGNFKSDYRGDLVKYKHDIIQNLSQPNFTVVDARSAERFTGKANEPRAGLANGHIPGSKSLPFSELLLDVKSKTAERKILFENPFFLEFLSRKYLVLR